MNTVFPEQFSWLQLTVFASPLSCWLSGRAADTRHPSTQVQVFGKNTIRSLNFASTHMALFSTNKWMQTWALLGIIPLLTSRAQNLGHLFTFQPLLREATKVKRCFASQSYPDYSAHRKILEPLTLVYNLQLSRNIKDHLFLSPPIIKRESLQFTSFIPYFHSEWLICEHNFSPNQIMQKRNAVLPVLLL